MGYFGSVNNYNREKNRKRKIHSSGGINLNNQKNRVINDIDYALLKAHTPNFMGKYFNNNIIKKNNKNSIKKPNTPEIKNMNKDLEKVNLNKINNKNIKRPSTAPHNNIQIKKTIFENY